MIRGVVGLWLICAASTGLSAPVAQQDVEAILSQAELGLEDLLRVAEFKNPTLAAEQANVAAKTGITQQAGRYPNPVVGFEIGELATADPDIRKEKVILEVPLVISGRRGDAIASARAYESAAGHEYQQTRREVFGQIHAHWADMLYFRNADEALADLLEIANSTLQIARARFEARAAPESHVTKAHLEIYELEVVQQRLVQHQTVSVAELFALLGGIDISGYQIGGSLDPSPVTDWNEVIFSPASAVAAAASRVEAARAAFGEAKARRIPDLHFFASYGRVRPSGENFVEAGIALPLPLFDRNQGGIAESSALVVKAEAESQIVAATFKATIAAAQAQVVAVRAELLTLDDQMLPAAQRGLAQAQAGYRAGRLPFLELVDAQRTHATIQLRTLERRRDLVLAEAELASLAGTGLYVPTQEKNHE